MQSAYLCVIFHVKHKKLTFVAVLTSLRTADAFPVVASLPPKKKEKKNLVKSKMATKTATIVGDVTGLQQRHHP